MSVVVGDGVSGVAEDIVTDLRLSIASRKGNAHGTDEAECVGIAARVKTKNTRLYVALLRLERRARERQYEAASIVRRRCDFRQRQKRQQKKRKDPLGEMAGSHRTTSGPVSMAQVRS